MNQQEQNSFNKTHPTWKHSATIARMAKYIWWKSPEEAMEMPEKIVAQVMNIGDYKDVCSLAQEIGKEGLSDVIQQAEPGEFNERSWHYWHYKLGLAQFEKVPPLPTRLFDR